MWLTALFLELCPLPAFTSAAKQAGKALSSEEMQKSIIATESAIKTIVCQKLAEEIVAHSRTKVSGEDQRQASVIGRAQGLFFAVALLSFVLTFAAGLLTTKPTLEGIQLYVMAAICLLIVIEVVLMVLNVLRAVSGIVSRRVSSAELREWIATGSPLGMYKAEAILNLAIYREASLKNDWRFGCLDRALTALRNVVIGVCILVIVFFVFDITRPPPPSCINNVNSTVNGTRYGIKMPCP